MNTRIERDSIGTIAVPSNKYYGAQTQRSINNSRLEMSVFQESLLKPTESSKKQQPQ